MGAGGSGNNQWEWEGNGNKTRLNLGSRMGMGMNHWEWEGMGLIKTLPLISTSDPTYTAVHRRRSCVSGDWKPPVEQSAA